LTTYTVISAVDETLRDLLWSNMEFDSIINGTTPILSSDTQISFEPPFQLVENGIPDLNALSLYLYRVVENGDMKNRPYEPANGNLLRYPPLALNLYYLVTPLTQNAENDHRLLGKVLQVFYDNAILKGSALDPLLQQTAEELRISLQPVSLDDATKLWSAFMRSYRLSACYEVKVVYIDSERTTGGEPVRRKRLEFSQIGGAS
jgi:hypothetical protein